MKLKRLRARPPRERMGSYAQAGQFDGVTVNVMTQTGAIQEPLQRRAPDFEKLTGAKINVIAVPFSDLYQKVLTDWASGTNSVDAAVFAPQWMVDYIAGGYLEDLTPRIAKDPDIKWDDIAPFFRDFSAKYNGKTYMVTLDGDFHMIYYRTDVFEAAGLKAAEDLGRLPRRRQGAERQGHERRRHAGLRLVHRQEAQRAELLVRHRRRRLDDPVEGHQPGRVLQHQGHDAAGQQRGLPQGARFPQRVDQVRPAERAQHGRQRHAAAVRLRPLRAEPRLGRRRHARHRPDHLEGHRQGRRRGPAGLEGSPEPRHRQARSLHQGHLPATRSTASTTRPSPPSAAGAAASTPTPTTR